MPMNKAHFAASKILIAIISVATFIITYSLEASVMTLMGGGQ